MQARITISMSKEIDKKLEIYRQKKLKKQKPMYHILKYVKNHLKKH